MPLKLYQRGAIWHVRGTVANKLIRQSLGTSDRKSAEILAADTEARVIRESVYGPEHETTFAEAALKYLETGKPKRYIAALIRALGQRRLSMIKPGDIKSLALELYPNAKNSTRNCSVVRRATAIINHDAELGLCHPIKVKAFPEPKVIRKAINRAWIDAFRASASYRLGALALFMFTTGARLGDAVALEPAHLDLENKIAIRQTSKTGDPRVFYLTDEMVEVLRALPPRRIQWGRGPLRVFGYASNGSVIDTRNAVCKRAQLTYRMRHEAGRHSFATEALIRRRIDPVTVAKLGGWSNPVALMNRYAHPENLPGIAEDVFGRNDTPVAQPDSAKAKKIGRVK
jgi:integrase